jgi:guanylate kinase
VSVFLRTCSIQTYEARLRQRGTETEEAIQRRLAAAARELAQAEDYDYQVINENLDTAVAEVQSIVRRQFERDDHAG